MKTTIRHLTTNIDYLLTRDNSWLGSMFGGDGAQIRAELKARQKEGHLLIGSENCNSFDPIAGCQCGELNNEINNETK